MVSLFLLTAAPGASLQEPPQQPGLPPAQRPTPEDQERAKLEKDMAEEIEKLAHSVKEKMKGSN